MGEVEVEEVVEAGEVDADRWRTTRRTRIYHSL